MNKENMDVTKTFTGFSKDSHYNKGVIGIKTGFIFSARGSKEKEKPVAGQTGKNLDILLEILTHKHSKIFPSKNRYNYRITNAAISIHYKSATNDTEAKDKDILSEANIKRVYNEIKDLKYLFLMGDKAKKLKEPLISQGFEGKIYLCNHLSLQYINRNIKNDINNIEIVKGGGGNNRKRLEVVAEEISSQIK